MSKQSCVSCGASVSDRDAYPYSGHRGGCRLAEEWRRTARLYSDAELRSALAHARREALEEAARVAEMVEDPEDPCWYPGRTAQRIRSLAISGGQEGGT